MKLHGTMAVNAAGHLEIGGCDTVELAAKFGTPLYVIDEQGFRRAAREYYEAFAGTHGGRVLYAGKAFLTTAMCRMVAEEGLGLDVVSGGEIYTALHADFPMEHCYFHGNNKSAPELILALESGVGRIVVDNEGELVLLDQLARDRGQVADILLRVTPGIEAHTHEYIKTGQIDSKFGFTMPSGDALEAVRRAQDCPGLKLVGVHCHIGSQVFELDSYDHTARVMMGFINQVHRETGLVFSELDLGGGLGIYYNEGDSPARVAEYASVIAQAIREEADKYGIRQPRLVVEPGRSLIGPAGSTLYSIGFIKEIPGVRKYVAVDGGMTDNIRPALYGARHEVYLANKMEASPEELVSITGKCCESGDMLAWDVSLPRVSSGDTLVMACTGAYCYAMSSNYNRLGRPAVVLVSDGRADLIVRREGYEDLVRNDLLPARLAREDKVCLVSNG